MDTNPYTPPTAASDPSSPPTARGVGRTLGLAILTVGLLVLIYGAVAFWLLPGLPPNGGAGGRLPSLYVMGAGIVVTIIGLAVRNLQVRKPAPTPDGARQKTVPTSIGLLILLAIIIAAIVVIANL